MSRLFLIDNVIDSDDWYTPKWVFDGLGMTFDLDVAAPDGGAPNVPARRHYTVGDDGLLQPWEGYVWCNPPYSNPGPWCHHWSVHEPGGCLLIRADMNTAATRCAFAAAHAVYLSAGRIRFEKPDGIACGAVNFSTVLLGRGPLAVEAMHRLASERGGVTRELRGAA